MAKKVVKERITYTAKEKEEIVDLIVNDISEKGMSAIDAIKARKGLVASTFYVWLKNNETFQDKYARACEIRCDKMAEEILKLADKELLTKEVKNGEDGIKGIYSETTLKDNVARTRMQIDARKWLLSKMMPKKYGNVKEEEKEKDKVPDSIKVELVTPQHNIDEITPD